MVSEDTQIVLRNIKLAKKAIIKEILKSRAGARENAANVIKAIRKTCK